MGRRNKGNSTDVLELEMMKLTKQTYLFYLQRIYNLLLSRFKWINLPPEIDERFLEWVLINNGNGLLFHEDNKLIDSLVFSRTALGGDFNLNEVPDYRQAYSISRDLTKTQFNETNSVICWNNRTRSNDVNTIYMFAQRLTNITRIIDTNIELQRQQSIIVGSETQRASLLAYLKKKFNFIPYVVGRGKVNGNQPMEIITPKVEFTADKLTTNKHDVWNEFLTSYGYNNANTDKKERMVQSEAESNLGEVFAGRLSPTLTRQDFCKESNSTFKKYLQNEMSVEWRSLEEVMDINFDVEVPNEGGESSGII